MAYDVPFSFNPSANTVPDINSGLPESPYYPKCNDPSSLVMTNYRGMVDNYVQNYGRVVLYQPTGFNLNTQNKIYGEDPTSPYRPIRRVRAIIDFTSYSSFISKWGTMSDVEIIIYIPIKEFQKVWGETYPLAGDLFSIEDSACDRPLGQSPIVFEVTEKHDNINTVDFMGGHYVWKLTAKRFDNSYEPNAQEEKYLGGPVEDGEYGKLESSIEAPTIIENPSGYEIDELAKQDFDNPNSDIYGGYVNI